MSENVLTIKEFQNWLSGVIEFQDEDWTPNEEQWNKIVDKIYSLQEEQTKNPPYREIPQPYPQTMEPLPQPQPVYKAQGVYQAQGVQTVEDNYEPVGLSPEEEFKRQQEMENNGL